MEASRVMIRSVEPRVRGGNRSGKHGLQLVGAKTMSLTYMNMMCARRQRREFSGELGTDL